jgi:hypothetical protein
MGIGSMKRGLHPLIRGGGGSAAVEGSFTCDEASGSWTGFGVGNQPSIAFDYTVANGLVTITVRQDSATLTNVSTTTGFTIVAGTLPTEIRPAATRGVPCLVTDNGVNQLLARANILSTGGIIFALGAVSGTTLSTATAASFTASGNKGLQLNFNLVYPL